MKAKEIEEKLNNGSKLIIVYSGYFKDWHFIGSEEPENKINKKQFEKYKKKCSNKDESEYTAIRGKAVWHYYWL